MPRKACHWPFKQGRRVGELLLPSCTHPSLRNHSIFPCMHLRLTMPSLHHLFSYQTSHGDTAAARIDETWTDLSDDLVRDRGHHICRFSSCPERASAGRAGGRYYYCCCKSAFTPALPSHRIGHFLISRDRCAGLAH